MFKEYKKLDEGPMLRKPIFRPIGTINFTPEDRNISSEAVNLIKDNQRGKIKGRTCANGSKKKRCLKDIEIISSPTVSTESIRTKIMIYNVEVIYISMSGVPGAYIYSEIP